MSMRDPSDSYAAAREYSEAVENLQALDRRLAGRRSLALWNHLPDPGMTPEEAAWKARYEATIAKHEPEVMARFPA